MEYSFFCFSSRSLSLYLLPFFCTSYFLGPFSLATFIFFNPILSFSYSSVYTIIYLSSLSLSFCLSLFILIYLLIYLLSLSTSVYSLPASVLRSVGISTWVWLFVWVIVYGGTWWKWERVICVFLRVNLTCWSGIRGEGSNWLVSLHPCVSWQCATVQ